MHLPLWQSSRKALVLQLRPTGLPKREFGSIHTSNYFSSRSQHTSSRRRRFVRATLDVDESSAHFAASSKPTTIPTTILCRNLLEARETDTDVHSYGRQHDDDSVAMAAQPTPVPNTNASVQIDPNLEHRSQEEKDDAQSYDASSAGFTTGSTRAKLHQKSRDLDRLLKENQELATRLTNQDSDDESWKTTKSTSNQLIQALARL
jgi:hypothetical protein